MPRKTHQESWYRPPEPEICPLCGRLIPPEQRDEHHLTPKSRGGKETVAMHRICHRQIHSLLSEVELAQRYNSPEALLELEEIRKFVEWVKTKPDGFIIGTRKNGRRRR